MSAIRFVGAACALALSIASLSASADVVVGGSAMFPQKNIVENAVNSKDHTTLVAAVKAAGLVETLESKGPFAGVCSSECGVFCASGGHRLTSCSSRKTRPLRSPEGA